VNPNDYQYVREMLKERSGIVLAADKQYLAESRLLPVARKAGLSSLGDLVARLKTDSAAELAKQVIEAMTTNESFFFRDKVPYDHFRDTIMPAVIATHTRRKRMRIWCAAAATGQEPYSLAMMLCEMGNKIADFRIEILATDLSSEVIERAKAGLYSQFEVQRGLPIQMLVKYFTQIGDHWQIAPELRAMVSFRTINLLHDFRHLGSFELIFCRNVLIYFDQPTKIDVLQRLTRVIEHDGFLVLGAAETVVGLTDVFKPLPDKRGLYVPNVAQRPAADAGNIVRLAGNKR
jgi:chemotaxis protein methyltransferase CheR